MFIWNWHVRLRQSWHYIFWLKNMRQIKYHWKDLLFAIAWRKQFVISSVWLAAICLELLQQKSFELLNFLINVHLILLDLKEVNNSNSMEAWSAQQNNPWLYLEIMDHWKTFFKIMVTRNCVMSESKVPCGMALLAPLACFLQW